MLCAFLVLLCRVLPYLCRATLDYSIIDSSVVVGWKAQASVGCYLYFTATSRPFFLMLDSATDGQNFPVVFHFAIAFFFFFSFSSY